MLMNMTKNSKNNWTLQFSFQGSKSHERQNGSRWLYD